MRGELAYVISVVLVTGLALTSLAEAADPNLVAWWKFDDGAGDTALDSSGNGHDGTLGGAPQWVAGFFDGALAFAGSGDYVDIAYSPGLALNEFTVSAWVKLTAEPGVFGIHGTRIGGEYTFDFKVQAADIHGDIGDGIAWLNTALDITAGDTGSNGRGGDLDLETWYAITYVIDNTNQEVRLYLDGDLKVTLAISGTPLLMQSGQSMRIGHTGYGTEWMNGLIDDVRIYDRALSTDEVEAMVPPKLKAYKPNPRDGAEGVETPLLQWTAGDTAISHKVYFGTNPTPGEAEFRTEQGWTVYWHAAGIDPGVTYHWRVDEVEPNGTVHTGDIWSFTAKPLIAWKPNPADGATDVPITAKLNWSAGLTTAAPLKHHLFFGTDQTEVADGTGDTDKGILDDPSYDPAALTPETVYYFRVNEVEGDGTEREGEVWSFETVAAGPGKIVREWWLGFAGVTVAVLTSNPRYPDDPDGYELVDLFEGPVDWADNYGSRLSGWLYPPATGDYTFWIATDDGGECWLSTDEDPANAVLICSVTGWVPSRDFDNTGGGVGGPEQRSAPISLEAGKRYYIEAMMKEEGGGDNISVAWQGPGIPVREVISAEYVGPTPYLPERAYSPSPGDGATGVPDSVVISWQPGVKAVQHDVYFGTDAAAVAAADTTTPLIYRGRLSAASYIPAESPLEWGQTYYLRVDEVNNDATISAGRVWSFTVADYIVVDDFEDYNDYSPHRIFQTWIDGFGYTDPPPGKMGNGTGSTVGYLTAPFAEQTTVHGGAQSMPFGYDNTGLGGKARYSEAEREYPVAQDFSRRGVKSMSLWIHGDPCNVPATVYVGLQDGTGTRVDVPETDTAIVTRGYWQEINIELGRFAPVNLMSVKKVYLGAGNRLGPVPGPTGDLFIDDIRLYRPRCVASELKPAADITEPYDCKVDFVDFGMLADEWLLEMPLQVWQERAAYWDASYPTAWAGVGDTTRDALAAAGYTILNASELKTWMDARIADGKLSVVVFCKDIVPDTVAETMDDTCTIRRYLDAGGKVVWYSDIPFYYVGYADGTTTTWGDAGAPAILGFNTSSAPRDSGDAAAITGAGAGWGLTQTWTSQRPAAAGITPNLTVLAKDDAGNSPAWVKHYVAGDMSRGFVRFRDTGGQPLVADIIRVAESSGVLLADVHEDNKVDFLDVAILGDTWLDELSWPAP
ncbi:MAG: hypothetical protein JSU70_00985 [Phycisphaerales bacterium]|nr:MAG: hypothetical protein JSU70_00985 [Phycisphaerales bacterium]